MSQVPKSMHSALSKDMMAFEEKLITTNFKFGVLYWKDGETEDDMYKTGRLSFCLMTSQLVLNGHSSLHSDETSPEFEKFLTLLGEKVELTRHQGYAGGLSTKGTHHSLPEVIILLTQFLHQTTVQELILCIPSIRTFR